MNRNTVRKIWLGLGRIGVVGDKIGLGWVGSGRYLRPVRGCIKAGCVAGAAVATAGFGLLTLVLLLANSSRIVCGMSGSNLTPCCEHFDRRQSGTVYDNVGRAYWGDIVTGRGHIPDRT